MSRNECVFAITVILLGVCGLFWLRHHFRIKAASTVVVENKVDEVKSPDTDLIDIKCQLSDGECIRKSCPEGKNFYISYEYRTAGSPDWWLKGSCGK